MSDPDWSGWAQMGVALLALAYTIYEARQARQERRAERQMAANDLRLRARPKIEAAYDVDMLTRNATLIVKNVGLGPALITRFRHVINGEEIDALTPAIITAIRDRAGVTKLVATRFPETLHAGTVLPVGETMPIFGWSELDAPADFDFEEFARLFGVNISYESIYGEQFAH